MLNSITEINSNPIVNKLTGISGFYGINGAYVLWRPGGLNEGGYFFLCGLDPSITNPKNVDMNQVLDNIMLSHGHIRTDIAAFRIDGQAPLMVHRDIVNYCKQLDVLQGVYGYFGKPIPTSMDPEIIKIMDIAWRKFLDPQSSPHTKAAHEKSLKNAVQIADQGYHRDSPRHKEYEYINKGYYDSGRGKIYNWAKKRFAKHKNQVSLEHLVNHAGRVNFASVTYATFPEFKKAMNNRPDILYHVSELRGDILDVPPEDGFGSQENNDRRFYTIHYPAANTKDVEKILLKINYPEEFNRSLANIDPNGYGIEHVIIPDEYFDAFRNLCNQNKINICIDQSARATVYGGIPVAFSAQHSAKAYNMLSATARVFEADAPPRMLINNSSRDTTNYSEIKEPTLSDKQHVRSDAIHLPDR